MVTVVNEETRIVRTEVRGEELRVEFHECFGGDEWHTRVVWLRREEVAAFQAMLFERPSR